MRRHRQRAYEGFLAGDGLRDGFGEEFVNRHVEVDVTAE
jgi:hypothetical protein